jgi:hypothetical protein
VLLGVAVIALPTAPASAEDGDSCGVDVCVGCDASGPLELSAGPDQDVADGSAVQLAGVASGSNEVCDIPAPAVWSQVGGTTVVLSDGSLSPTFTAPDAVFWPETLTFRLSYAGQIDDVVITVFDDDPLEGGGGVCEFDPFQLSAGPDQTVDEGTLVQLAGVAQGTFVCDTAGPALWTQVDGPTVSLTDDYLVPTFTAPQVTGPTVLTFRLAYEGETDDVLITVDDVPAVVTTPTTPTTAAPTTTTTTATTTSVEATPKAAETTSTTAAVLAAQASAPLPRTGATVTWTAAVGVLLILLGAGSLATAAHLPARSRPRLR